MSIPNTAPPARPLVLGSTSPYRRELLQRLQVDFEVVGPQLDETPMAGETPLDIAQRLAVAKAHAVAVRFPGAVVIGSDQVADLRGVALGKPLTHEKAVLQLRQLRGQPVVFHTAVAVVCHETSFYELEVAQVRVQFRALNDVEIEAYLLAEQPYDCAGSAKSEGLGISLLDSIESDDPTALVGLPFDPNLQDASCSRHQNPLNPVSGKLYLIPAPLDFGCSEQAPLAQVMPAGTLEVAARLDHWICENAKSTRAYLKRIHELRPLASPLQGQKIAELPRQVHKKGDHDGTFDARPLLAAAGNGHDIGLVSEAGMPAIADPGSSVVRAAHDLGIPVVALVGPASLLLALASSGLNGQNFAFHGYLPQDEVERLARIRQLEALAIKTGQTQIFIETPYRNSSLLGALLGSLQDGTRLAVSWGLTLPQGYCRSAAVRQWKKDVQPFHNSLPAVFAFGR